MSQGVQAFKAAKYDEAIAAFQRAVDLDPRDLDARLYLGTSFFVQYIPGAQSPENAVFAEKAREQFEEVLKIEPQNRMAIQYLGSLAYQTAAGTADPDEKFRRLDAAKSWYEKLTAIDPRNKEAWYSLGVIDWMKWYPRWMKTLNQAGLRPDTQGPIPDGNLRQELKSCCESLVDDGLNDLRRALDIDPQYDAAMAYMNLLIRERASLRDSQAQYDADVATADDWVQKALEAKKNQGGAGVIQEPPNPGDQSAAAQTPTRIRVGGNVQRCNLLTKVDPVYPPLARQARIQGTVQFQAIIGADGHIQNLQLVSGHPLLIQAAQEAARQWVYRPTLLNGKAVEVVTTVEVKFSLEPPQPGDNPCGM